MIWLPILLVIACLWLLGWAICRMVARQDAAEAHANLARLLADVGATHASPLREHPPAPRIPPPGECRGDACVAPTGNAP